LDKGKSKIKRLKEVQKKWTQKVQEKRKKKIAMTSRKETYGEERKIKTIKEYFHNNHKILHTCTS
jgi:Sec7-like guanine-nucleotide exchange factor